MKRVELMESGVVFNEEDHTYNLKGKFLSGITGILHRQLFEDEFDGIDEETLKLAASYGTVVHKSCELFDNEWVNDNTPELTDYITLCRENDLTHEISEYTVTDGEHYASNIDKVYRTGDNTFSLADIKTYSVMNGEKLEKARWQLSIYAYLFELQNKKAKVDSLYVIHLRNKEKRNGDRSVISKLIPVARIPSEVCRDLLETDLRGDQFKNPYSIPDDIRQLEAHIRELIAEKTKAETELDLLKSEILKRMTDDDIRQWFTETMKITRKLPSVRTSFNLALFKQDHPDIDYAPYMRESEVSGSLLITV